jgi:hypothetical protein
MGRCGRVVLGLLIRRLWVRVPPPEPSLVGSALAPICVGHVPSRLASIASLASSNQTNVAWIRAIARRRTSCGKMRSSSDRSRRIASNVRRRSSKNNRYPSSWARAVRGGTRSQKKSLSAKTFGPPGGSTYLPEPGSKRGATGRRDAVESFVRPVALSYPPDLGQASVEKVRQDLVDLATGRRPQEPHALLGQPSEVIARALFEGDESEDRELRRAGLRMHAGGYSLMETSQTQRGEP